MTTTVRTSTAAVVVALGEVKVVPVLRSPDARTCIETARDLVRGGLTVIEVTFTTPDALTAIAALAAVPGCIVGAGTVLTPQQAADAVAAGAAFLVAPVDPPWFVDTAHELGVLAIPGCASPTEIHSAHARGADLIKVFPIARLGGAAYLRDLLAPMPDLPLMATGGVSAADVPALLDAGCIAVGLGSIHTDGALGGSVETRARSALAIARGGDRP